MVFKAHWFQYSDLYL